MRLKIEAACDARTQARRMAARIAAEMKRRGGGSLALPGGTSPGLLMEALARADAGWARVTVTLTDERWVSRTNAASNERLLRRRLLVARARTARFVAPKTARSSARAALGGVTQRLRGALPLSVCVVGMGEDGHIASLFPGEPDGGRAPLVAVTAPGAAGAAERISLSLKTIAAARRVIVYMRGDPKRAALLRHLAPDAAATPVRALFAKRRGAILVSWAP